MADEKGTANYDNEISVVSISERDIRSLIYTVRGQQVMLDSDLAMLYQVETKVFNQAVKRNEARFPDNFRFQLTREEYDSLRSQFVTSKIKTEKAEDETARLRSQIATSNMNDDAESVGRGGRRYLPYVFTEQGIAMLSAVLKSDVAVQVSINIMNTFVEMRRFIASNAMLFERISEVELRQLQYEERTDAKIDQIFDYISEHEESSQRIFFEGQIYDAFSLIVSLIQKAEGEIILIDGYVDIGTLNLLCKKKNGVAVTIYTDEKTRLSHEDIEKFNAQYPTLEVKYTKSFHDRFLILDGKTAYLIGASLKDAGRKCFGITMIQSEEILKNILGQL